MHDVFGRELQKGDIVLIPAVITDIHPYSDFCNITAKSLVGRKPDGLHEVFTLNSRVVVRNSEYNDTLYNKEEVPDIFIHAALTHPDVRADLKADIE